LIDDRQQYNLAQYQIANDPEWAKWAEWFGGLRPDEYLPTPDYDFADPRLAETWRDFS
jgi:hypothetical protein